MRKYKHLYIAAQNMIENSEKTINDLRQQLLELRKKKLALEDEIDQLKDEIDGLHSEIEADYMHKPGYEYGRIGMNPNEFH